jgi:sporulation protein YlmC with PRC-barrel domain
MAGQVGSVAVLRRRFVMTQAAETTVQASDTTQPTHPLIESDRVEGTAVYDRSGKRIGTVERVMIDKISGRVAYAVMSFGGFFGVGADEYAVPWSMLDYDPSLGGYRTQITAEQLRNAPSLSGRRGQD